MRMRLLDTKKMCVMHLLREHAFLHRVVSMMQRRQSVAGYILSGKLAPFALYERHERLEEVIAERRDITRQVLIWKVSPLPVISVEGYLEIFGLSATPPPDQYDYMKREDQLDGCIKCQAHRSSQVREIWQSYIGAASTTPYATNVVSTNDLRIIWDPDSGTYSTAI